MNREFQLSESHRQMLEDGCPKPCLRENTTQAQEALERLRRSATRAPEMRIANPKDRPVQAAPTPPPTKPVCTNGTRKKDIVAQLLSRKEGCTVADVLTATGWTKVGMPDMAKSAGLKLRKVKEGDTTRYFGSK